MDYLKDKANKAVETVQGKGAEANAEADKEAFKGNAPGLGLKDQLNAGKEYVVDKKDQKSHEAKADAHDAKAEAR
ncbi:hypothetical protein EPUS_08845 [Endocarpon pusillum Z07020]|uniref:Glucose-repressible protein n=1 Tax=Endocarpon pusillum (strain Z07020 / HMAS-L-300199) TaxID=1263415 RepID=U1GL87_ENDPU|nr:uncharacterized protein EPUS_08845 [Endocarpon pusillum Z07020]ERF72988.1 hypothetical protein EPUS_08845 [Endocarpon pusillum Z07020]